MPILGCLRDRKETLISERFHLGGIAYLRGFQYKGLGDRAPRREATEFCPEDPQAAAALTSDALGGDVFARVRAAVRLYLPQHAGRCLYSTMVALGCRTHVSHSPC